MSNINIRKRHYGTWTWSLRVFDAWCWIATRVSGMKKHYLRKYRRFGVSSKVSGRTWTIELIFLELIEINTDFSDDLLEYRRISISVNKYKRGREEISTFDCAQCHLLHSFHSCFSYFSLRGNHINYREMNGIHDTPAMSFRFIMNVNYGDMQTLMKPVEYCSKKLLILDNYQWFCGKLMTLERAFDEKCIRTLKAWLKTIRETSTASNWKRRGKRAGEISFQT